MANLAYIQLTRFCNQECRFCSNPPNTRRRSLEEIKKIIDKTLKLGYTGFILTGGEPTLYEDLWKILEYCKKNNIHCRIITNGQRISDFSYLENLYNHGLYHIHLSLYSIRREIQAFLTNNPISLENIIKALNNLGKIGKITVDINTVINKYNAGHLYENVDFIVKNFNFVQHFVWNNLDPLMNRASKNKDTIPRLNDFELQLHKAMEYLRKKNKTFRVERVPLCYMTDFAEFSTETRKIVNKEERIVYFLDKKGVRRQKKPEMWFYDKARCCSVCGLNNICAGLYQMDKFYFSKELSPVFINEDKVIKRIKCTP